MTSMTGKGDEFEYSESSTLKQLELMGYTYISKEELNKERKNTTVVISYDRLNQEH